MNRYMPTYLDSRILGPRSYIGKWKNKIVNVWVMLKFITKQSTGG